jgi:hypothetical protein
VNLAIFAVPAFHHHTTVRGLEQVNANDIAWQNLIGPDHRGVLRWYLPSGAVLERRFGDLLPRFSFDDFADVNQLVVRTVDGQVFSGFLYTRIIVSAMRTERM